MILILLILVFICLVAAAAHSNAIMDLISPKDALASRGYKWSKAAMEEGKDRNHDGKISYFENAWPDDAWHKHKRLMFIFLMLACACAVCIGGALTSYSLKLLCISCLSLFATPILFFLISASFEYFYTHIKK